MSRQLNTASRGLARRGRVCLANIFIWVAVIFISHLHGVTWAGSPTSSLSKDITASFAGSLERALSASDRAEMDQVLAPSDHAASHRFSGEVAAARRQWLKVALIIQRCRQQGVALPRALRLKARVARLIFLARYGLSPAEAADRLRHVLHGGPELKYNWEVRVALLAGVASGMLGPGVSMHRLPNGKWSKPVRQMPTPAEAKRSWLDRRLSLRYALRAASRSPTDPVTGYMLSRVPLPRSYNNLQFWGGCLFLDRWRSVKAWYKYSGSPVSIVVSDLTWNIRRNAPDVLAAIQRGVWNAVPPVIPSWAQMRKSIVETKKRQ